MRGNTGTMLPAVALILGVVRGCGPGDVDENAPPEDAVSRTIPSNADLIQKSFVFHVFRSSHERNGRPSGRSAPPGRPHASVGIDPAPRSGPPSWPVCSWPCWGSCEPWPPGPAGRRGSTGSTWRSWPPSWRWVKVPSGQSPASRPAASLAWLYVNGQPWLRSVDSEVAGCGMQPRKGIRGGLRRDDAACSVLGIDGSNSSSTADRFDVRRSDAVTGCSGSGRPSGLRGRGRDGGPYLPESGMKGHTPGPN